MNKLFLGVLIGMLLSLAGCQTAPKQAPGESQTEVVSAIGTMTKGLTNQNLTEKDLKNLAVELQKDPQSQSAVRSVNDALNVQQGGVKYCPKDGRRFSSRLKYCPYDGTELKPVE
jgi:hypothetical protein